MGVGTGAITKYAGFIFHYRNALGGGKIKLKMKAITLFHS